MLRKPGRRCCFGYRAMKHLVGLDKRLARIPLGGVEKQKAQAAGAQPL